MLLFQTGFHKWLKIILFTDMASVNTAAKKVLKLNGFEMEGFLHNAVIKDGTVSNLCIYGLLKDAT